MLCYEPLKVNLGQGFHLQLQYGNATSLRRNPISSFLYIPTPQKSHIMYKIKATEAQANFLSFQYLY